MYCSKCGLKLASDYDVCPQCGNLMRKKKKKTKMSFGLLILLELAILFTIGSLCVFVFAMFAASMVDGGIITPDIILLVYSPLIFLAICLCVPIVVYCVIKMKEKQ